MSNLFSSRYRIFFPFVFMFILSIVFIAKSFCNKFILASRNVTEGNIRIKMNSVMFSLSYYHKILNSIICFYSIYVMDKLCRLKIPSQVFLHYKSVFKNISIKRFIWMILRSTYIAISPIRNIFSTFPILIIYTNTMSPVASVRTENAFRSIGLILFGTIRTRFYHIYDYITIVQ